MTVRILTGKEAKHARESLGLSQRKLALNAGVNRQHLGLFESQGLKPSKGFLTKLHEYLVANDAVFGNEVEEEETATGSPLQPKEKAEPVRTGLPDTYERDGYVVIQSVSSVEADAIIEEIDDLNARIEEKLEQPTQVGFFGAYKDECDECLEELKAMMVRSYCLIRSLHGVEVGTPCHADEVEDPAENQDGRIGQWLTESNIDDDELDEDAA